MGCYVRLSLRSAVLACLMLTVIAGTLMSTPSVASAKDDQQVSVLRAPTRTTPAPMPKFAADPMVGMCDVFRMGATAAKTKAVRQMASSMLPTCEKDASNSAQMLKMTTAAYQAPAGVNWAAGDADKMRQFDATAKSMTKSMKASKRTFYVVLRSSMKAVKSQIKRAAKAATKGERLSEARLPNPAKGVCKALRASIPQSVVRYNERRYRKAQRQNLICKQSLRSYTKAWNMVDKTAKKVQKDRDSSLARRDFWSSIADAFRSFFASVVSSLEVVTTLGGLLPNLYDATLVEPGYSAFVNARNRVLAGMDFFADAAAAAENDRSPLQLRSSSDGRITIMAPGTSSYTGETVDEHPKLPLEYLMTSGGTGPYRYENADPDSSISVSSDGVISGWIEGISFPALERSPGFGLGVNVRVTDAEGRTKVQRIKIDYIFKAPFRLSRTGAILGRRYDGCPYDCVQTPQGLRAREILAPRFVAYSDMQWASSASATSSYGSKPSSSHSAFQATGRPSGITCEDHKNSWTSKKRTTTDTLTLRYDRAVVPRLIRIYEMWHPGGISKVVVSGGGRSAVAYSAAASRTFNKCPTSLSIPVLPVGDFAVDFPIDTIAITVDQGVQKQRTKIDGVQLVGADSFPS